MPFHTRACLNVRCIPGSRILRVVIKGDPDRLLEGETLHILRTHHERCEQEEESSERNDPCHGVPRCAGTDGCGHWFPRVREFWAGS